MAYSLVKSDNLLNNFPSLTSIFPNLDAFSVGFDREWQILENLQNNLLGGMSTYHPYNIKRIGQGLYEIEMAAAGFKKDEIHVELDKNQLVIRGDKEDKSETKEDNYVYKGITSAHFRQTFALADHVKVKSSTLKDGMLKIELEGEIPATSKPQVIEVK